MRTDSLTFVERKSPARSANPFTNPETVLDAGEILKPISAVREEKLKRLDDDIALLTKYLQSERVPKAALKALEALSSEVHESWESAVEKIEELLD